MASEYLKEFERLNTTTESIYDLGDYKVLIIMKNGTNLTSWHDVTDRMNIIYISENLSDYKNLSEKYKGLPYLKAIVAFGISDRVKSMRSMFSNCNNLADISTLKDWDVSNVTDMAGMFCSCPHLVDLSALKDWDVSNVTNMKQMFDASLWEAFGKKSDLADLSALKDWDVSNVTNMELMFSGRCGLTDLTPLKDWNVSKVTNMKKMFSNCGDLADLSVLNDWKLSGQTNMKDIFFGCRSLADGSFIFRHVVSSVTNELDLPDRECPMPHPQSNNNFTWLDSQIHSGSKEIELDSDIVLADGEELKYPNGIPLDVNDIVIDGKGHAIHACGKTRMFNCNAENVTIRNLTLKCGFAKTGGAITINNSHNIIIENCKFINNVAESIGGAIYNYYREFRIMKYKFIEITNCEFANNVANYNGGAIYNNIGNIFIAESSFDENVTSLYAGALWHGKGRASVTDCEFLNNATKNNGGAINNFMDHLTVEKSRFIENTAENGGAIVNYKGTLTITDSTLNQNTAKSGGAILNRKGKVKIADCEMQNNVPNDDVEEK